MARTTVVVVRQPTEERNMTDFNHIEQLVARVARGRQDRPDTTELALLGFGLDPFGDSERALDGYLEDPRVDESAKTRIRALLAAVTQVSS